jgi:hypothetical protein
MAISTFGVTYSAVQAHHFPQLSNFSTTSNPKATTVTEMISASAATLAGKLRAEGLTPSAIEAVTSSEGYAWCAEAVRLGAAIRVLPAMTGVDPAVAKAWQATLDAKWEALAALGYLALGDASAPSQEADGPRSHISNHGLDTGDTADVSDVIPTFRRSDVL